MNVKVRYTSILEYKKVSDVPYYNFKISYEEMSLEGWFSNLIDLSINTELLGIKSVLEIKDCYPTIRIETCKLVETYEIIENDEFEKWFMVNVYNKNNNVYDQRLYHLTKQAYVLGLVQSQQS
jgi:hypothetical protein